MYKWYSDPGHAWLEVSLRDLNNAGIYASHISPYSYRDGNIFYLEEDCDAGLFISNYAAIHGAPPAFHDMPYTNSESFIRDLERA
tara:strand:- start:7554 stop:7808 length:255 start_codon:yes stop_codon:yes gene_type:complete